MRVARGSTVDVLTDPFNAAPTGTPTAVCTTADGQELSPAPVCTVVGSSVSIRLLAASHTDELDRLLVSVDAVVDSLPATAEVEVEVIGSLIVTRGALRAEPGMTDLTRFPDQLLDEVIDEWSEHVEDLCNVRFTPGYDIEHHRGTGLGFLLLEHNAPRVIRAVWIDGELVAGTRYTLDPSAGFLELEGTFPRGAAVEVHLESGLDRPPPKLSRELKKVCRSEVFSRGAQAPSNAISETSPDGGVSIRYSTPDPAAGRWTGYLTLDPLITELRRPAMAIA